MGEATVAPGGVPSRGSPERSPSDGGDAHVHAAEPGSTGVADRSDRSRPRSHDPASHDPCRDVAARHGPRRLSRGGHRRVERFGPPEVLANAAGVVRRAAVVDADPADWRRELAVDLLGAMNATRLVVREMLDAGSGHVVNVSSVNAAEPAAGGSGYPPRSSG